MLRYAKKMDVNLKKIAILGKPNVGKSSLFNRMIGQRVAITSDISGTTRDSTLRQSEVFGRPFELIDTGGLDSSNELFEAVRKNSLNTANKADIILYVVDGKMLPDDDDRQIFYSLQKLNKPLALIINKIDNQKDKERSWEFENFGAKPIFRISVSHNLALDELYEWLELNLPKTEILQADEDDFLEDFLAQDEEEIDDKNIKIGIIGRVNVGKSSLLNALVKSERAVVSSVAGTTIDPVNECIEQDGYNLEFIDTAGLRKRGKIEGIEKFALNRTQSLLENSHIALLTLDASEELKELDERIAGLVDKYKLGCIIVLNKWDKAIYDYDKFVQIVRDKFKFLSYAPIITLSALTKQRVHKLTELIIQVYQNYSSRIPTARLNELIEQSERKHPIPADKGKKVKVYFATQFGIKPPKIALVMNRPKALHFSYKRYIINQLRKELDGTPIIIIPRKKGQRDEE